MRKTVRQYGFKAFYDKTRRARSECKSSFTADFVTFKKVKIS